MKTSIEEVALETITPAKGIDPRRARSSEAFQSLMASIKAEGVLQPPILRRSEAGFEILAGNRRVAAIRALIKEGASIPGMPGLAGNGSAIIVANVVEAEDDGHARLIALSENTVREDLHQIDEFEMVAKLIDKDGQTVEGIASRFGWSTMKVRQRLALGQLHPTIRDAWRAEDIDDSSVKAFTRIPDPKRQKAVFEQLKQQDRLFSSHIRAAAGCDHNAVTSLRAVGVEAYKAAGGAIVEDLFGDDPVVCDPALVQQMAADKIEATCRELEAAGWSFAVPRETVKDFYLWPRMQPPKVSYTADERKRNTEAAAVLLGFEDQDPEDLAAADREQHDAAQRFIDDIEKAALLRAYKPDLRKKAGCFVWIDSDGLQIEYGRQRPAEARKEARAKDSATGGADAAENVAPAISNAVATDLSAIRTVVAAAAMEASPHLALAALLASVIATPYGNGPLKIQAYGMPQLTPTDDGAPENFFDLLNRLRDLDVSSLGKSLAVWISRSLDLRVYNAAAEPDDEADAIVAAIDPAEWQRTARECFDPQNYFSRIPIALSKAALVEMLGADYEARGKKGELVEAAVAAQKQTGWLPQQLRHPSDIGAQS